MVVRMSKNKRRGREKKGKTPNKKVKIYCEGYTEKHYFDMLRKKHSKSNISVSVEAVSQSHKALVKKVINKEKVEKSDVVVIVFDNDNQSTQDISQAISDIRKNNYYLFYTNQCFELWLLLHLESVEKNRSLNTEQLNKKLETYCQVEKWKNYKNENFNQIQEMFEDNVECAMKNALKLNHGNINVTKQNSPYLIGQNPYTNIHRDLKVIFNITKRL